MRLGRRARRGGAAIALAGITIVLGASSAPAAPVAADFLVLVTAGTTRQAPAIPNGGTAQINALSFRAGAILDNNGGEEATAKISFVLPDGLRFGADAPDPTESCIATATTAECQSLLTVGTDPSRRTVGWDWDVVADRSGSYVLRAEIVQISVSDPDLSSNTASATVVLTEQSPPATVSASKARLTPAKPKAGSVVSATVRVTAGGTPVRPTGIVCAGTVGSVKVRGTSKAGSGTATYVYRTPKNGTGKTLRGSVSLRAGDTKFTRRFSVKLG